MLKSDPKLIKLTDVPAALGLLSRLPVRGAGTRGAAVAWAFPVVGLIIGLILAAVAGVLAKFGLSPDLNAGLILFVGVMITGAMHEDGLADSADGLWGGWDRIRRLEIMKDSQIGTYGVIALIVSFGLRWAAIAALIRADSLLPALIGVAVLSRLPMVVMMAMMQNARGDGLSASAGRVGKATVWLAIGLGGGVGAVLLGGAFIGVIGGISIATLALGLIAKRKIGGQTGDILGASQQVAEITALVILATL
ncbi:MAG TPA: adenosylcobinamide-GDP ribazoletransferase [Rhodobacteraceae bacterium]|nr:adenosylcobinamide-GDP ribazoletransferase [Paracoccaceae bacterium]